MPGALKIKPARIGSVVIGAGRPAFILGPCVIESAAMLRRTAAKVARVAGATGFPVIFKASYDKANRTSASSFRGGDLDSGCRLLAETREEHGWPVTTDVHSPEEAERAAEFVDLLQIPAFLCRQTDLITAAARTGRAVNVKKGQFLAPWDVGQIAGKLRAAGCKNFFFTERGTTFGYQNLVADMRSLYWIRQEGFPVVFDATHSVQRPGGAGATSGGDGELAPVLARAAVAAGCDGVFMETHEKPEKALSDGPNMIPLNRLEKMLKQLWCIHEASR